MRSMLRVSTGKSASYSVHLLQLRGGNMASIMLKSGDDYLTYTWLLILKMLRLILLLVFASSSAITIVPPTTISHRSRE